MERLPSLSYFFPALNEEAHVEPLVERALEVLPTFAERVEVTVVDDGSSDRTGAIADALARRYPNVRAVHHERRRGYGGAVRSGMESAREAYVFFTDGDRQFDPGDLGLLLPHLDGAAVVAGYRARRSDNWRRLFVGWGYNLVIWVLFGLRMRDVDCAFKLFRREVLTALPLSRVRSNGAFFSAELLLRLREAGVRVAQVPIPHHPRTWGTPKGASPRVILRAIRDLLELRVRLWLERGAGRRARIAAGRSSVRDDG